VIRPRLLLITNRKSYTGFQTPTGIEPTVVDDTGFRLAPNSMTRMTLNAKIRVFMDFFVNFGLQNTFRERIAPKSINQIDMNNKRRMNFSALNVNFDGPSLDFLGFKKTCIKER